MLYFFKLPSFDVRLLGAIAVALFSLALLSNLNPVKKDVRSEVARGEPGILETAFALCPTSAEIATADEAGRVRLWALEKGWQTTQFLDFPGYARAVAFSPDGRFLAVAGFAPDICLWDLTSGTRQHVAAGVASIQRARLVSFSPDGRTLAVSTDVDGTVLLWDLATRRERMVLHHPSPVVCLAFSPDGRWLATAGNTDRSILLWDVRSGSRRVLVEGKPGGNIMALAFSPDGTLLASASYRENDVRLWDLDTRRECRKFVGHERSVNSVAFSPDGSLLATAGNDGKVGLWTVTTGQRRASLDGQATWLQTVAFSPDGRTLILATGLDGIRWWDIAEVLRASSGPSSAPT